MNNYEENDLVFDILELCLYSCVVDYIHYKQVFRRGHKPRTINFPYQCNRYA